MATSRWILCPTSQAIRPLASQTTQAFCLSLWSTLRCVRMSETFWCPDMPMGTMRSPSFHGRTVSGNSNAEWDSCALFSSGSMVGLDPCNDQVSLPLGKASSPASLDLGRGDQDWPWEMEGVRGFAIKLERSRTTMWLVDSTWAPTSAPGPAR